MANKNQTFVKIHDNLLDHPAWMELSLEHIGLWVVALGYCRRNGTDGEFPARAAGRWGGTPVTVAELVSAGRFHEPGHGCAECPQPAEGRLYVHAYLDHQNSNAQRAELSRKRAEAGRAGGISRSSKQVAKQSASTSEAESSNVQPEREREREDTNTCAPADADRDFETFWESYPKKRGKGQAVRAYRAAVKKPGADPATILAALAAAVSDWQREGTKPEFVPYPATWLNGERWADVLTAAPAAAPRMRTANQCANYEPHTRHPWENGRNLHMCLGVDAR